MSDDTQGTVKQHVTVTDQEIQQLRVFQDFILNIGTMLDLETLLSEMTAKIASQLECQQVLLLVNNQQDKAFEYGALHPLPESTEDIENFTLPITAILQDPPVSQWLAGEMVILREENTAPVAALDWLRRALQAEQLYSMPLMIDDGCNGLLLLDNGAKTLSPEALDMLQPITTAAALALRNALIYTETVQKSATGMLELSILRQIDRELNDTIELDHVFDIALDWALRFTNANAASLSLYDQERDELRLMRQYGYDLVGEELVDMHPHRAGIAYRVALSGKPEVIPDVSMDKDFIRAASFTNSQVSVPILREDRVVAVITVESRKINGFTDHHLDFVEKLAARAGVAVDNARLFGETKREREKLSHILNNTADIVIVTGMDDRLILINPSAYQALRLYPSENYVGRSLFEVLGHTRLVEVYRRAKAGTENLVEEIVLPDERTFHINLTRHENIGWIIVMHDITPFKEMDQLKSELIATVSHDLKQPLSVMNGYTELLLLHKQLDTTGTNFVEMVRKSITSMRQLIDDLLDLAKIESGIQLDVQPVSIKPLINDCIASLEPNITSKKMHLITELPDTLPAVRGDSSRLQQIMLNLIGNAVKYTQPEGTVIISAEHREQVLRISVQDNGMGISPEDQSHIFDRFYRVRRPETDSIDGTGLGLAIVKSLVEAHEGKIGLESRLGEGTTFTVTLPAYTQ